jgi:hypothetical protein
VRNIFISFSSPDGKGSGLVTFETSAEINLIGFNVIVINAQGQRVQQNDTLITCNDCVNGAAEPYSSIIPKHKSGRNIFIEMLRIDGIVQVFGPAVRQ